MRLILLAMCAVLLTAGSVFAGEDAEKKAPTEDKVLVLVSTTLGDFVLELNAEKAPITVENFLAYTEKKGYDGTIFLRGCRMVPWQQVAYEESRVQQLPRWARKVVGDRNVLRRKARKLYLRLRRRKPVPPLGDE